MLRVLPMSLFKPTLLTLFLLHSFCVSADDPSVERAFPALKKLETDVGISLYYAPATSQVLSAPHPDLDAADGIALRRPLRTQLSADSGWFTIDCDSGPSDDPSCTFQQETTTGLKLIRQITGQGFVMPGNGAVYVFGRADKMFDQRHKFEWQSGKLQETQQPFYYVGLESTALQALQLLEKPGSGKLIASIPKGAKVTVLLNQFAPESADAPASENYLVKTEFGLVGWIKSPIYGPEVIAELRYFGD